MKNPGIIRILEIAIDILTLGLSLISKWAYNKRKDK